MFKSAAEIYLWHHDPDSIAFLRMDLREIVQTVYRLCALLEPVNQYWGEATFSFGNILVIMIIMIIFSYSNILVMIMVINDIWKHINKSNKWREKSIIITPCRTMLIIFPANPFKEQASIIAMGAEGRSSLSQCTFDVVEHCMYCTFLA